MLTFTWTRAACLLTICCGLAAPAFAQDQHVYIDVRFGASHLAQNSYPRTFEEPLFGETATFGAAYDFGVGGSFEVGGGYMFTPIVGVGVNISGNAYEGFPELSARIPSPAFTNAFATDSGTGNELAERGEAAANPHIMINATPGRNLRARLFGGPSFFMVEQDVVDSVSYSQDAGTSSATNSIQLTNYDVTRVSGTGVGFHLGGDLSYFFTRVFGAGGYVTYTRGHVELEDPGGTFTVTAGGVSYGGAINFRF